MARTRWWLSLVLVVPTTLGAQEREGERNLQVLPADIPRPELNRIMRGFSFATGYRCADCHVGEEGQPLNTYDFASDDRALKRKAREMLRMVGSINERLAGLPDSDEPAVEVTCLTCHGGVARPEPIESIVERTATSEGADAAVLRYRELREQYFGRRAYDFGERPLLEASAALSGAERHAEALAVLELARGYFPESSQVELGLGQVYEALGRTQDAITAYRRVLELAPGHPGAERRLQALGGG